MNQDQVSNMLSVSGLKLERMLTMIYKKRRNFKIESINNEIYEERPPKYIGLNQKISSEILKNFENFEMKL